jgi:amidohydrolase
MRRSIQVYSICFALLCGMNSKVFSQASHSETVHAWLESRMEQIVATYTHFHTHPELSFHEVDTAATFAKSLTDIGFEVHSSIGGHGVVATLSNGDGPKVMLRTDLDALPVTETTPLPFASKVVVAQADGSSTGVMHACGHDVHITNLLTVAQYLAEHRATWSGTLMVIGQPAEERGMGARAMLKDGLFDRFGKPDFAVALHVAGDFESGKIRVIAGPAFANVDSVDIVVKGRGGHGSAPHTTIDPIVQAAELVMSLQTIVARENDPSDPAVITVGSIHGGTKHNIIGNDCRLQLTVRSYTDEVRKKLHDAITRKAKSIATAYNAPEPEVTFSEGTPSLNNNAELAAKLRSVFETTLGVDKVEADEPSMGGEDFSEYGLAGVPILMYRVGTVDAARLDRFKQLGVNPPSLHSSDYYPDFEKTIQTTVATMTAAVTELMPKR